MAIEIFGELPLNLIMLRHGRTERNAAHSARRTQGIPFPDKLRTEHDSFTVLTPDAIPQTEVTGAFLNSEFPDGFDRYITSDIPRALQTARYLALNHAQWEVRGFWRERDWGEDSDFSGDVPEDLKASQRTKGNNPFQWGPRGGESQSTGVATRLQLEEYELRQNPPYKNVLVVSHGDVIQGAVKKYLYLTIAEWNARYGERTHMVENNMIVQLSRFATSGSIEPYFQRIRGICKWDPSLSWNNGEWIDIRPPQKYTNDELHELFLRSMPKSALHTEVRGDF